MKKLRLNIQLFAGNLVTANKTTTYGGIKSADAEAHQFVERALKESIYEEYDLHKYADDMLIPKNNGDTLTFRKLDKYEATINTLTEGQYPDEDAPMKIYDFEGLDADVIEKGGTGYDITKKLPDEIENGLKLDYSLYPDCDYSLVFLSRGCVRRCKFCLVNKKEGLIHSVKPVHLNPKGKWIDVLDNNFFASPDWKEHLDWLKE